MTKGITFKKGSFDVALASPGNPGAPAFPLQVDGYVSSDGAWGFNQTKNGWVVTHLASGYNAGPTFRRMSNARKYAKVMASRPDLWKFPEEWGVFPAALTGGPTEEQAEVIRAARDAAGSVKGIGVK